MACVIVNRSAKLMGQFNYRQPHRAYCGRCLRGRHSFKSECASRKQLMASPYNRGPGCKSTFDGYLQMSCLIGKMASSILREKEVGELCTETSRAGPTRPRGISDPRGSGCSEEMFRR